MRWRAANAIERAIGRAHKQAFRVIQYSIQPDHIHLVVEAEGRITLMRGIRGLAIRMAKAINFDLGRRGPVFAERYHARALRTPREVRNALVYVIQTPAPEDHISPPWEYEKPLIRPARTWLAATGWRRYGLIDLREEPVPHLGRPPPRGNT